MEKILSIIETQPMLTAAQIAAMVDRTEQEVVDIIEQCKREGMQCFFISVPRQRCERASLSSIPYHSGKPAV